MPAKPKVHTEHAEQKGLLTWAALASVNQPKLRLLFAIPNGGARSKATAGKLKAEGVKPGVPDLCLPVARGGFFGLWLEMKRIKGGTLSPEQIQWHQYLVGEGYYVITCKGQTEAEEALTAYLALPATPRTDNPFGCPIPHLPESNPPTKPTRPSKARITDYTRKPKLQWCNDKPSEPTDQSGSLKPISSADYDRSNYWCQGWLLVLNHVIRRRNHSCNDKQRARLDVRINQLRTRHNAALKRRQPFAAALLKRQPNAELPHPESKP